MSSRSRLTPRLIKRGAVEMSLGAGALYSGLNGRRFDAGAVRLYTKANPDGKEVPAYVNQGYPTDRANSDLHNYLALRMNQMTAREVFGESVPVRREMLRYQFKK